MQVLTKSKTATVAVAAVLAAAYCLSTPGESSVPPPAVAASAATLPIGHPLATHPAAGATAASASVADVAALQDQISALTAELARLRDPTPAPGLPAAAGQTGSGTPAGHAIAALRQKNDPALREQARRAAQAQAERNEAAFRAEGTDPGWATATAAAVRQALAGEGASDALAARSVECRSQTCRVELDPSAAANADEALPMFALRMAGSLSTLSASQMDRGDGSPITVLYLSR